MRRALFLGALLAAGSLAAVLATEQWSVGEYRFLIEDVNDRSCYQQRGRWLPSGRTPYLEEHSEYPQIATWMFGLPYLWFDSAVPVGRAQTVPEFRAAAEDVRRYADLHSIHMGVALLLLFVTTACLLSRLGHSPSWALLLFLPATVYFSYSRFDAVPALFVSLAIGAQLRGRLKTAAFCLALGGMTKWYPILLLPVFLAFNARTRKSWPSVLAPALAAGATCLAILAVTWLWDGGGLPAVLHPYQHHLQRGANQSSLLFQLTDPQRWGWLPLDQRQGTASHLLTALQFLPALLLAAAPIRTTRSLLLACLTIVLGFVLFSKVFSPQWVVWIAALAALVAPACRPALLLWIALEALVYLQFPVLYYQSFFHSTTPMSMSDAFWTVCTLRIAVLAGFWAWSLGAFLRSVLTSHGPAQDGLPPLPA